MYRGYFRCFSFAVILALCSIDRVSAIKCYKCDSDIDGPDCTVGTNQTRFAIECVDHSFVPTTDPQGNNQKDVKYNCGYSHGVSTINNKTRVVRGCAVETTTCDTYTRIYKANHQIELDSCKRCEKDLCNSSGHLKTGIWSLSLCLIAVYFFKL